MHNKATPRGAQKHRLPSPSERLVVAARRRLAMLAARAGDERGDVPGWVMVTLMSALIVAGIYAVAGPALIQMFNDAIGQVGGLK